MITLISDGGSMTVGRRTASFTWGSFDVVLPDGTEQEQDDGRIVDGYIYRPDDRGKGRGELTFVRADARIDMNAEQSDLEDTLDQASRRTEGAVFYTREVSGLGLGKKIPGVDYTTGDLVDVLVWGKKIALPVTGLRRRGSADRGRYDAVQVGGQALSDPERQRKLNSDLDRQIAAEKRQRLKEAGEIRETADTAKSTADTAKDTADTALDAATDADGVIQSKVAEARRLIDEGREAASQVEGHLTEARQLAGSASQYAELAIQAADQADQILITIGDDVDAARGALAQVQVLHGQVQANLVLAEAAVTQGQVHVDEADRLAGVAAGHAAAAELAAASSGTHVAEAEALNSQVKNLHGQVTQLVSDGSESAATAQAAAALAGQKATAAQSAVSQAQGLLVLVEGSAEDAHQSLADAQALLDNAGGNGVPLSTALLDIVRLHQATLTAHDSTITLHTDILKKQGAAITAASTAAGAAGAAAADAGKAAKSALDAVGVLQQAQGIQTQINSQLTKAVAEAGKAATEAGKAATSAGGAATSAGKAAGSALEASATNTNSIKLLGDAQGLLRTATSSNTDAIEKLRQAQELTNDGVRAAAAAAAYAGAATMQNSLAIENVGKSASSALEATAALADAVEAKNLAEDARDIAVDASLKDHADRIAFQEQATKDIEDMQRKLARATTRMLEVQYGALVGTDECWRVTIPLDKKSVSFTPVSSAPSWAGKCVAELYVTKPGSAGDAWEEATVIRRSWNGSKTSPQTFSMASGWEMRSAMLLYNYAEGTFERSSGSGGPVTIGNDNYVFGRFTAPATGEYTASASTTWDYVRGGSSYYCAIARGPGLILIPISGDSRKFSGNSRNQKLSPTPKTVQLSKGETFEFIALTDAPTTTYRSVEWQWAVTWLQQI